MPETNHKTRMLLSLIKDAFPQVPLIEMGNLSEYEETGFAGSEGFEEPNAFSGRLWDEIDVEFLREHYCALYFFKPIAWHYYIPAFMCSALANEDANSLYVDTILREFRGPYGRNRLELLSDRQLDAILLWLGWILEKIDDFNADDVLEAMDNIENRIWIIW